jgi:hypothetical protein
MPCVAVGRESLPLLNLETSPESLPSPTLTILEVSINKTG